MDRLNDEWVAPPVDNTANGRLTSLPSLWKAVLQYKWGIVFLVLLAMLAANLMLRAIKPIYQAGATIIIDIEQAPANLEAGGRQNLQGARSYLMSQYDHLHARSLAEKVVSQLDLNTLADFKPTSELTLHWREWIPLEQIESVWPFDPGWLDYVRLPEVPQSEQARFDTAVSTLLSNLTVEPIVNSPLVKVRFDAHDPELAALVSNTLAQQYIDMYMTEKVVPAEETSTIVDPRLEELSDKLQDSVARLRTFRESEVTVAPQTDFPLSREQIEQLAAHSERLHKARLVAEKDYQQTLAFEGMPSTDDLLQLPAIKYDPMIQSLQERLDDAEQKAAILSRREDPPEIEMISVKAEISTFRNELEVQVQRVARDIESVYRTAEESEKVAIAQLEQAKKDWEQAEKEQQETSQANDRLLELENIVASNLELYNMILAQTQKAPPQSGPQIIAHARVIEPATPPKQAYLPDAREIYLALLAIALGLGLLRAWLCYALDKSLHTLGDIREKLHVTGLGTLPTVKTRGKTKGAYEGVLSAQKSSFAEAIHRICSNLDQGREGNKGNVILVTSILPEEGKSTLALNLAEALGETREVLLIDGDFHHSQMASILDISPGSPGLTDLLADTAEIQECLHPIAGTQANVMVAGTLPTSPEEVLASRKCKMVMAVLKKMYSHVIIDGGSLQTSGEATLLSTYADAVILVTKANATSVQQVRHGLRKLREIDAPLAGIVLNHCGFTRELKHKKSFPRETVPVLTDSLRIPDNDVMPGKLSWQVFRRN